MTSRLTAVLLFSIATTVACATSVAKDPELVSVRTTLERTVVPAAERSEMKVVLDIESLAPELERRLPFHVAVVLDTSGSMIGSPMKRAQEAAVDLLGRLDKRDRLTLIAFNTTADVIVAGEAIADTDLAEVRRHIEALEATGTTNVYAGLAQALEHLRNDQDDKAVKRVVFLSDGRPNNPALANQVIDTMAASQFPITALGLGLDYDESLLTRAARKTGGVFHFVDDEAQLAKVFERELLRLDRVVAKNAYVTLTPGPGIRVLRVEGHPRQIQDKTFNVPLGDLSAGESREIVLSIEIDSRRDGVSIEVLDAMLIYEDAVRGAGRQTRRNFVAALTSMDAEKVSASEVPTVRRAAARARAGSAALDAIQIARAGQKDDALKLLDAAISTAQKDIEALGGTDQDQGLQDALNNLLELKENLPNLAARAELDKAEVSRSMRQIHQRAMEYTQ